MHRSDDCAEAIVRILREFGARGDVSFLTLLAESSYHEAEPPIDVPAIERALRGRPELVGDWLQHSEDWRGPAGWFFGSAAAGGWEVGFIEGDAVRDLLSFEDRFRACAVFVMRRIGAVGAVPSRRRPPVRSVAGGPDAARSSAPVGEE
jgi:hypothetical protein